MKHLATQLFFLFSVLFFAGYNIAGAGDLDPSFGANGTVATTVGRNGNQAYAVKLQPDGKILVAGSISNSSNLDFALIRYNPDGSLDTSFNSDGVVIVSVGSGDDEIRAIALQDDGTIIAAGYSSNGLDRDLVLARFHPDGTLDRGFGLEGISTTAVGSSDEELTSVVLDSEGRILTAGYAAGTSGRVMLVARFQADGSPDSSFAEQGISLTGIGVDAVVQSIALQADGKIVASGTYADGNKTGVVLLRYQSNDGSLDQTFGHEGVAVAANDQQSGEGFGMQVLEDDSILVAGSFGEEGKRDAALYRFSSQGEADTSFGDNGVMVISAGPEDDAALAIAVGEKEIGLAGYTTTDAKRDFLFIKVTQHVKDTQESPTVQENESTYTQSFSTSAAANSVVHIGPVTVQDSLDSYLASTESASLTWSAEVLKTELSTSDNASFGLALQPDGKMLAVGYAEESDISSFALARYADSTDSLTAASTASAGSTVSFITTRTPSDVTRTTAISGGDILSGTGLLFSKRGVVFSITPDPVYRGTITTTTDSTSTDTTDTTTTDTTTDTSTSTTTDTTSNTSSSDQQTNTSLFGSLTDRFVDEGYTEDGSGPGGFGSKLAELRPGTFYYVRAYAMDSDGNVYYGNQLGVKTADACFIATAAYGSLLHPYVQVLRNFRDSYLLTNTPGRIFVRLYYHYSPPLARIVADNWLLRVLVRVVLLPVIALSWLILHGIVPTLLLIAGLLGGSCYCYRHGRFGIMSD